MARERFIKSDLDEGRGVEGKRPRDAKASVDEESDSPLAPEEQPVPDERDRNIKGKKEKTFVHLSIKEDDDANIFR